MNSRGPWAWLPVGDSGVGRAWEQGHPASVLRGPNSLPPAFTMLRNGKEVRVVFVKCPFLAPCVGPQTQTEFMDKGSPGTLTQLWEEGWRSRGPGGRAPCPPDTGEGDPPSLLASPPLPPQGAESEGWCYSAASWAAGGSTPSAGPHLVPHSFGSPAPRRAGWRRPPPRVLQQLDGACASFRSGLGSWRCS